jgi:hypothetical protein
MTLFRPEIQDLRKYVFRFPGRFAGEPEPSIIARSNTREGFRPPVRPPAMWPVDERPEERYFE